MGAYHCGNCAPDLPHQRCKPAGAAALAHALKQLTHSRLPDGLLQNGLTLHQFFLGPVVIAVGCMELHHVFIIHDLGGLLLDQYLGTSPVDGRGLEGVHRAQGHNDDEGRDHCPDASSQYAHVALELRLVHHSAASRPGGLLLNRHVLRPHRRTPRVLLRVLRRHRRRGRDTGAHAGGQHLTYPPHRRRAHHEHVSRL